MSTSELTQIAHLLRRAGFGASREEFERYAAKGCEATVEELLHPEDAPPGLEYEDLIRRYRPDHGDMLLTNMCQSYWVYRMVNSSRPLEEKVALLWHGIFATAFSKVGHPMALVAQTAMFRRYGLGSFHTLLEIATTHEGSGIVLVNEKDPENTNQPPPGGKGADGGPCLWWRRGESNDT